VKDDKLYLIHMNECINRVNKYTTGGRDEFMSESIIQDAVVRNLQVMAESSKRISDERKNRHLEVNWQEISGFRNILVHDYLGVDLELVWNIVTNELPGLETAILIMLKEKN
jgi:uncharacterized protein with HEPN domain